ncbi:unnamed protein product [Boreogadus saida]
MCSHQDELREEHEEDNNVHARQLQPQHWGFIHDFNTIRSPLHWLSDIWKGEPMVAICEAFSAIVAYFSQALSVSRTALLGGRDLLVGLSGVSCIKAKQPLILFPSLKRNQRDSLYFGRRYCHRGKHAVPCSGGLSQWAVGLEMSGRRIILGKAAQSPLTKHSQSCSACHSASSPIQSVVRDMQCETCCSRPKTRAIWSTDCSETDTASRRHLPSGSQSHQRVSSSGRASLSGASGSAEASGRRAGVCGGEPSPPLWAPHTGRAETSE